MLVDLAPWAAVAALVAAALLVAYFGFVALREWRRFQQVNDAARALLDVHHGRLEATLASVGERAGVLATDGEELAGLVAELRADLAHLRWLLDRIPAEREELRRTMLDMVLPTERRDA